MDGFVNEIKELQTKLETQEAEFNSNMEHLKYSIKAEKQISEESNNKIATAQEEVF